MQLLERERDLSELAAALAAASAGNGRLALVSGEAGIGKTAFVEHFVATRGRGTRVLRGNCDALFTPSPLAPLHDVVRQLGSERLRGKLDEQTGQVALFSSLLDVLQNEARPVILFIDDIHWADEATLDLIRYLSRRIAPMRVLLIATHRDDEISHRHPLKRLLGSLARTKAALRIELTRLSIDAVHVLSAGKVVDVHALHRLTSGNPFFVSEIVAAPGRGIPTTARDAIMARAVQLKARSRSLLELAAVIGTRIEVSILEEVVARAHDSLSACIAIGILVEEHGNVAFRHDLAREAILQEIDPLRRRRLYRAALDAAIKRFAAGQGDPARIAHYAEGCSDAEAVVKYGLIAARAAAALGAHREATSQFRRVLRFADGRPATERALCLKEYAEECATIDNLEDAINALREAVEIWRGTDSRLKEGEALTALAWPLVRNAQNADAEKVSDDAIAALKEIPPSRQLASAYRAKAHLRMLDRDRRAAVHWGNKAIELATRFEDHACVAAAEMVVGAAKLVAGDDRGRVHLDRSLALAQAHGLNSLVALIYLNTGSSYGEQYRFDEADRALGEGIAFGRSRDLDNASNYMSAWLALTRLYQGRWTEATDYAAALLEEPDLAAISRIMALVALGRVRARRGDPGAAEVLDEALKLASSTGTLQRLAPVRAARAELAWLKGGSENIEVEARAAYELAVQHRHRWHVGELLYWRVSAGNRIAAPDWIAKPFALEIAGHWKPASDEWRRLGCPYEEGRALAQGDTAAQMRALEIFDTLGAAPAALALRQRMRAAGVSRIPRGRRASTRQNPFGLTIRELDTLGALARGLSNRGIAAELGISAKTVDHHVSAVLAKLGATSREEAARIAQGQHLIAQNGECSSPK